MTFSFDPDSGLVIVRGELGGISAGAKVRLALDTGATRTVISAAVMVAMGYEPTQSVEHVEILTASGTEMAPVIELRSIKALGVRRTHWPVISHTLPSETGVHGLLGLDFLRGARLSLDFQGGTIELSP
jgi:predicted aspartyl protease